MGITVAWDDEEQTILRMTFAGTLGRSRSFAAPEFRAILMMRSVEHPVYVVSDFSEQRESAARRALAGARPEPDAPAELGSAASPITQRCARPKACSIFSVMIYMGQRTKAVCSSSRRTKKRYEIIDRLKKENGCLNGDSNGNANSVSGKLSRADRHGQALGSAAAAAANAALAAAQPAARSGDRAAAGGDLADAPLADAAADRADHRRAGGARAWCCSRWRSGCGGARR